MAALLVRVLAPLVAATIMWLAIFGVAQQVFGAEPTTCSFPALTDDFQSVANLDKWTAPHHNRLLCAINRLQDRAIAAGAPETVCSNITVPASTRQLVNLTTASSIPANTPAFASVVDPVNPSRLQEDGIQGASGTTVAVWVFNHDSANSRAGRLCATVIR